MKKRDLRIGNAEVVTIDHPQIMQKYLGRPELILWHHPTHRILGIYRNHIKFPGEKQFTYRYPRSLIREYGPGPRKRHAYGYNEPQKPSFEKGMKVVVEFEPVQLGTLKKMLFERALRQAVKRGEGHLRLLL